MKYLQFESQIPQRSQIPISIEPDVEPCVHPTCWGDVDQKRQDGEESWAQRKYILVWIIGTNSLKVEISSSETILMKIGETLYSS